MKNRYAVIVTLSAMLLLLPRIASAQPHDLTHGQPAAAEALVHFGVVPTAPLGPPPCAQTAPFGTVADPCIHKAHRLSPEEVTLLKGGEVTFQVHNGGHAIAIYEVSKDTTRDQIGQALCPGDDPVTLQPAEHLCPAGNNAAAHQVFDGRGDIVLVASPSLGPTDAFVTYSPGRLVSAGTPAALNGNAVGHTVSYRFLKTGRYLVLCINRSHLFNDWMFGFVNVVGGEE